MASVTQTLEHINNTLKSSKGYYSNYSCKTVSWDDVQRGTIGGGSNLSCWGANITDTRLYAKDGRLLYTIRGDNWNERLGKVTSNDLTLVAATDGNKGDPLKPFTLRHVLDNVSKFGSYAGIHNVKSLSDDTLDEQISVRFQTTFLPLQEQDDIKHTAIEFAPEAYNYNTTSDDDPRNLILLCTTQGIALQQDGSGAKKLFHHVVEPSGAANGKDIIHRYWLEAESSSHKVGGSQLETKEEKEDAIQRGKATSSVIGIKSMETRFNVLMTIQIPLKQKERNIDVDLYGNVYGNGIMFKKKSGIMFKCGAMPLPMACAAEIDGLEGTKLKPLTRPRGRRLMASSEPPTFGKSSAARVSRGSKEDTWSGLSVTTPLRHPHEHITATIVMYYTCSGGVPTEDDVKAAIDDLESLYQSVETSGHLADSKFDFMKGVLTVKDMSDIVDKVTTQPPSHDNKGT